ncbi:MarR family transcriptional regulator [Glaciibacter flavus]|uniref:MarR family transcriptional regulator n=1 Tax=Orlajensenia flava TaxID=2565934 RepID=A0A4S4FPK2_9MICO|nr:MarR family transcriptional regulator [Glaciibacter flavus]THG32513.1 MarR family transcriptional regulator [Glaciibacter flavus]
MTTPGQASQLRLATFRLARRLRTHKSDDSVTDAQFTVLGALSRFGPHTLSALAERERVSAPSMNRTVNCLEEAGLIMRSEDSADRRRTNIEITASGTDVVTRTVSKRDAWLTERLNELSHEDHVALARATEIMARFADQ